jgi:hypothetical protein
MKTILLSMLLFFSINSFSQKRNRADTTTDITTSTKYIVDSTRSIITALDSTGKQLWVANLSKFVYRDRELEPPQYIISLSIDKDGNRINFRTWQCSGMIIKESGKVYCCACD